MNLSILSHKSAAMMLRTHNRLQKSAAKPSISARLPFFLRRTGSLSPRPVTSGGESVLKAATHHAAAAGRPVDTPPAVARKAMAITIDAASVTDLRYLVMGSCHGMVSTMRIESLARNDRMRVTLILDNGGTQAIIDAVMRCLPRAEFGRVCADRQRS